ncbi:MAG: hypothetical protein C0622_05230 [Desulfuromonas sp.]|nr:MAG: hypothetical protein C0622_05230 [Desulfuromonas sp.]
MGVMSEQSFYVVYDGPALEGNEIDVRQLAPALHSIGDLVDHANRVLHGKAFKAQVKVKGSFKTGCFGIDLTFVNSLLDGFAGLFTNQYVEAALNVLEVVGLVAATTKKGRESLLSLLMKIQGRQIKKVVELEDGKVRIELDDEHFEIEKEVLNLLRDYDVRKAVDGVINEPLKADGVDTFGVGKDKNSVFVVKKNQSSFFSVPLLDEEVLNEYTYETMVKVVNVAFQDDNMWRLTEGDKPFFAKIEDGNFLDAVKNNDKFFAKDDIFKVRIRLRQVLGEKGNVKSEHFVEKILDHRSAAKQIKLPFE